MTTHIAATSMACSAGGRTLIRALDLTVAAKDVVEIVGENGIGKSTLLRTLAGLSEPAEGEIERCVTPHYYGHRPGIVGVMTPIENLRHAASLADLRPSADALGHSLARVGLWASRHKPCNALSAGQQRRVGLAALEIGSHEAWLLDEPMTSLDVDGVALVASLIETHVANGGSVVAAIHGALGVPARRVDLSNFVDSSPAE